MSNGKGTLDDPIMCDSAEKIKELMIAEGIDPLCAEVLALVKVGDKFGFGRARVDGKATAAIYIPTPHGMAVVVVATPEMELEINGIRLQHNMPSKSTLN